MVAWARRRTSDPTSPRHTSLASAVPSLRLGLGQKKLLEVRALYPIAEEARWFAHLR